MTYDPWADLRSREHLTFGMTELPIGDGWWLPDIPGIALDSRLSRVERRCVLAHDLVHAERDDWQCSGAGPDGPRIARRRECSADELAAARLIPLDRLADVLCWALGPDEVADELDVTEHMVRVRVRALTDDEKGSIEERIARRWECA